MLSFRAQVERGSECSLNYHKTIDSLLSYIQLFNVLNSEELHFLHICNLKKFGLAV